MQDKSDVQLLRDYTERGCEPAFRELVIRHTDFVYSAALRQVNSPDRAGDIAQSVFTDLARKARLLAEKIPAGSSLAGWLHRSTRYAALNHLRDERRRLTNERQAMEQFLTNSESAPDWEHIRPVLDEALDSLGDEDREALLLRYFKNHDFRAVGLALGVSDDAAQKRVSRAVERLHEFFAKRGVTIGASGLVAVVSANAVHAAPIGLAAAISTASVLAGAAIATTATATTTQTIAMTTIQKTLYAVTLAAAVGTGVFETQRASRLQRELDALPARAAQVGQVSQLQQERDAFAKRLAAAQREIEQLQRDAADIHRLRGEVTGLRSEVTGLRQQLAKQPKVQKESTLTEPARSVQLDRHLKALARLAESPEMFPMIASSNWVNAGFATPAAAFQTLTWARGNRDTNAFLAAVGMDPKTRELEEERFNRLPETVRAKYGSLDALLIAKSGVFGSQATGFRILAQYQDDPNYVTLSVQEQSANGSVGGGWTRLYQDEKGSWRQLVPPLPSAVWAGLADTASGGRPPKGPLPITQLTPP